MNRRIPPRLASGAALLLLIACTANAQPGGAPPPRPVLEAVPPLPDGAIARIGRPPLRFAGSVINVAFAPSGTTFVTTRSLQTIDETDRLVVLWDAATGKEIRQFRGHKGGVEALAFTRDGERLATGGRDSTVRLWRVATGTEIRTFTGHAGTVLVVDCSPDGRRLASEGQDATIRIWDVESGDEVKRLKGHASNGTSNLKYSPDGALLASVGADFAIRLWDPDSGNEIKQLKGPTVDSESLDFSRDGKRLAAISDDGKLWVWDVATGKELVRVQAHSGNAKTVGICVRVSPDGTLATGGADGTIRFWDTDGKPLRTARGHSGSGTTNNVSELSFSADGSMLASVSHDGTVRLWDVATGFELIQTGGTAARVTLSMDGKRLATSTGEQGVRFWDPATGKQIRPPLLLDHSPAAMGFMPDGRTLITAESTDELRLWDVETGKRLKQVGKRTLSPATRVAVSPGGRFVGTSGGNTLAFWDTSTWTTAVTGIPGQIPVRAMAFSPDDARVVVVHGDVVHGDGRIHLWDLANKLEPFAASADGPSPGANAVAWSPEGRLFASIGVDSTLRVWEAASGRERITPVRLRSPGWSVAFSPDGRFLAAGESGGLLRLFDGRTGKELISRFAHTGVVGYLAFTPDGRFLISAGADIRIPNQQNADTLLLGDGMALIWDVSTLTSSFRAAPKPAAAEVESLWEALKNPDAAKAHDAIWRLAAAPELALPLLKERLPKVNSDESDQRVKKLLGELDNDDFDVREKATKELIGLGSSAIQAVRQEIDTSKSREVKRRAREIVAKIGAATATRPEAILLARGMEVLQRLGGAEARKLLEQWAEGPAGAPLTVDAKATLSLLGKRR